MIRGKIIRAVGANQIVVIDQEFAEQYPNRVVILTGACAASGCKEGDRVVLTKETKNGRANFYGQKES